jgi:hypothetical protein
MNSDGTIALHLDGRIAIRLRDYTGLQFETLWAELHPEHSPEEITMHWLPANAKDDRDIWILIQPTDTWLLGDVLTLAAGGSNNEREDVSTQDFTIQVEDVDRSNSIDGAPVSIEIVQPDYDEADLGIGHDATLSIATKVSTIDEHGTMTAYRIQPDHVFTSPQRVWISIPDGMEFGDLAVMYYKGTDPNRGWHNATDIEGFLADNAPIILDGYYGVVVNHAGVIALSDR